MSSRLLSSSFLCSPPPLEVPSGWGAQLTATLSIPGAPHLVSLKFCHQSLFHISYPCPFPPVSLGTFRVNNTLPAFFAPSQRLSLIMLLTSHQQLSANNFSYTLRPGIHQDKSTPITYACAHTHTPLHHTHQHIHTPNKHIQHIHPIHTYLTYSYPTHSPDIHTLNTHTQHLPNTHTSNTLIPSTYATCSPNTHTRNTHTQHSPNTLTQHPT